MLIYKVSELNSNGFEYEAKYFQFYQPSPTSNKTETAYEYFHKRLDELKRRMPLVDKKDLNGEEPVQIQEERTTHEDFVRSATLKYWESFDTDDDINAGADIAQMVLLVTKHELIDE